MIEITTGMVFLLSSMYGSGQNTEKVQKLNGIVASSNTPAKVESIEARSFIDPNSLTDPQEMEKYLRDQYADTPILVDIARCESTFRQYDKDGRVIRGRVNGSDVGLMQINEYYHGESADKMGIDIYTVEGNIAFAKYLYDKYGSKPWSASAPCWSNPKELARN